MEQDRRTLLITNVDMEPCTVDPQLRVILQWLVASEVEVTELAFHDSAKKEFVRVSACLMGAMRKCVTEHGIRCHMADRIRCPFIVEANSWVTGRSASLAV